jgi:ferredoxin
MLLNSAIFFFSQQGSTKRIAEMIADGLTDGENRCTLIPFTKLQKDLELVQRLDFKQYDLIGFGTPVYYFYPPDHLFQIFKALPRLDHARGFLFCTSGGNPGATLSKVKNALAHTDLRIIDGCDRWRGLDQHRCYSHFPQSALPKSLADPSTPLKTDFWAKDNIWARGGWKGRDAPFMELWFPEFRVNEAKCTQCGECAERCPVDAIILDPYPQWVKACNRCYLCDLYCPEQAIECDWTAQIAFMDTILEREAPSK